MSTPKSWREYFTVPSHHAVERFVLTGELPGDPPNEPPTPDPGDPGEGWCDRCRAALRQDSLCWYCDVCPGCGEVDSRAHPSCPIDHPDTEEEQP